jgi:penicillin-binding protein 2
MGDSIGKQGIEFSMDEVLRGTKGLDYTEVDATGRILRRDNARFPQAGTDIFLSIDSNLQKFAAKQLEGQAGAIVIMEPYSGRLLALVSQPGYDNNIFTSGLSNAQWADLRDDPMHPLQNRAVQSVYPPGSVWKLIMAAAAFNANILNPRDTVHCSGSYTFANHTFRCWKRSGHGTVNLHRALISSCDVYFYKLGERLGVDRIHNFATQVGFGVIGGIELPTEKPGLVPSREWKRSRFNEPWHGGENLNLAIGQGYTLTSPLQIARFVSALINGGNLMRPTLLRDVDPQAVSRLPITDQQRELIVKAMIDTVEVGTAKRIKVGGAVMGGKTGTAQVVKLMNKYIGKPTSAIPYKFRDHAWLASFGEKDGKTYVIVGMIEHGGGGSSAVGPVLNTIYSYLFNGPQSAMDAEMPEESEQQVTEHD